MTYRRALMKMILKALHWILFSWSCSRISATSWQNMRIRRVFRTRRMSGWISSGLFPFIRCFRRLLSSGDLMYRHRWRVKILRATEREMTTPLLLLRCVQLGIHISELELLTIGTVMDMYSELQRDDEPHNVLASQDDFDRL